MIYNTNNYLYLLDGAKNKIELYVDGVNYSNELKMNTLTIQDSINSSDIIYFRNVEGASVSFQISKTLRNVLTDKVATFYMNREHDGVTCRTLLGSFILEKPSIVNNDTIRVIGYDAMIKFNIDCATWYNQLVFPITVESMIQSLCNFVGVPCDTSSEFPNKTYQIKKAFELEEVSAREFLSYLNEITVRYWKIDRNGILTPISLVSESLYPSEDLHPSEDLYPTSTTAYDYERGLFKYKQIDEYTTNRVTKVVATMEENEVGVVVGTGNEVYRIEGNILISTGSDEEIRPVVQNIYDEINLISFTPCITEGKCLPFIECGDRVGILDENGNMVETIILQKTMSRLPYGVDRNTNNCLQKRGVANATSNRTITRINGKFHKITNTVDTLESVIGDENSGLVSTIKQTADSISTEVSRATTAEGELSTRITQNATSISSKVSSGDVYNIVSQELEGVVFESSLRNGSTTISGDCITTGEISASRISGGTLDFNSITAKNLSVTSAVSANKLVGSDGATAISINGSSIVCSSAFEFTINSGSLFYVFSNSEMRSIDCNHITPRSDNVYLLGESSYRWKKIYGMSSTVNTGSDIRLKHDVKDIDVNFLRDLEIIQYIYNNDETNTPRIGLIANNYADKEYAKYFIRMEDDGYYSVDLGNIYSANIKYTQLLEKRIEVLEKRLLELEKKVGE